jgi:hypothetical protein
MWPGYNPSQTQWIDPVTAGHGERLARIEQRVDGLEEDQAEDHSILMDLREAFTIRASRSVGQIIQQRWFELAPIGIAASALIWGNKEVAARIGWWLLGGGPE